MGKRKEIVLSGSLIASAMFFLLMSTAVNGLVLHPGGEPDMVSWVDRPSEAVVGRVHYYDEVLDKHYYGSCVAIGPNFMITARHVIAAVGSSVYFDNVEYIVRAVWYEPSADGSADLRVCGISKPTGEPADLSDYVELYTSSNEVGKDIVIGGFGQGRGDERPVEGPPYYGYDWTGGNTVLRFGQNEINWLATVTSGSYESKTVIGDFDDLGTGGARPYEAAVATWDSGGGWFIDTASGWKLAGISAYTSRAYESWYYDPGTGNGDSIYAVRISSYDTWIEEVKTYGFCMLPMESDMSGNCAVNIEDLGKLVGYWLRNDCSEANNWCEGSDFEPHDGIANMYEFSVMASEWLSCYSWPSSDCD